MKVDRIFTVLVFGAILSACNTSDKETKAQPQADSASITNEANTILINKFKTINVLPFTADTTLMFHMETCDSLGAKEVKQLDLHWTAIDSSWSEEYVLKEFYQIDSIKASGTYASWCDSLQPGMTKSSKACAIGKIALDDKTLLLVWGLNSSSYEACPFTTMQDVYVSILKDQAVTGTFKLAEYISSADPPVAMQRIVSGTINKDLSVDMNLYEEDDEDMDQPELSVTRASYRLAIKDGKISTISRKKEEPVKIKRKK